LFGKPAEGEISLSDLRSELAHGGVTLLDKTHRELVRKNLFEMERISNEFLLRVLFHLNPEETVPTWSGRFQRTFKAADPRSFLVATTDEIFPKETVWNIRAEWCE